MFDFEKWYKEKSFIEKIQWHYRRLGWQIPYYTKYRLYFFFQNSRWRKHRENYKWSIAKHKAWKQECARMASKLRWTE